MEENITETNEPRSLDELLKLDTYQGMTDEEIDIIIDFHVNNKVRDKEHVERMQILKDYTAQKLQIQQGIATQALEKFNSLGEAVAASRRETDIKIPSIAELEPTPEFLEVTDE